METQSPQIIDYNATHVTSFLSTLDAALNSQRTEQVQSVWTDVSRNRELTTVYLTVMTGKMLMMEEKKGEKKDKDKDKDISISQVVSHFKLGDHAYNASHRLLSDAEHLDSPRPSTPRRKNSMEAVTETTGQIMFTGSLKQGNILLSVLVVCLEYSFIRHEPSLLHILDLWHNQCRKEEHFPVPVVTSTAYLTEPLLHSEYYQQQQHHHHRNHRASIAGSMSTSMVSGPSLSHAVLDLLRPHPSFKDSIKRIVRLCLCFDVEAMESERPSVAVDHTSPASMAPGCAFMALQRMSASYGEQVLQAMTELVEEGAEDMRLLQLLRRLLGYMHLQGHVAYPYLSRLVQKIKPLYIQPLPLGSYAKDTLLVLKAESLLPGCAMRQRLFRHTRRVSFSDGTFRLYPRRVHLLLNKDAEHAPRLMERVSMHREDQRRALEAAQANLFLNILEEHNLINDAVLHVPTARLAAYYPAAYVVVSRGVRTESGGGNSKVRDAVGKGLTELRERVVAERKDADGQQQSVERERTPRMPDVELEVVEMPEETDMLGYEAFHKIYRLNTWYHRLLSIVQEAMANHNHNHNNNNPHIDQDEKCAVDVVVGGGSGTLQRFVNGYVVLHRKENALMEQVQLRVYLLPLGHVNMLSSYLERHDGWFSTLLHVPMLSHASIMPSSSSPSQLSFPQYYLRRFLSNYILNADHPYPVSIMRCECIYYESSPLGKDRKQSAKAVKAKTYVMTPFCQEAEISATSHALYLKNVEKKKAFRKMRPIEIEQHKSFKYSGHSVTLSYVPADTMGHSRNREVVVAEEPRTYSTIRVRTVTRFGHSGSNHGPHHRWFEITAVDHESSRKNKRVREMDNADHYHAYKMTIVADGDTYIMLDGELYGPYHKFMISAEEPNSSQLSSFHVHTFDTLTSEFN